MKLETNNNNKTMGNVLATFSGTRSYKRAAVFFVGGFLAASASAPMSSYLMNVAKKVSLARTSATCGQ